MVYKLVWLEGGCSRSVGFFGSPKRMDDFITLMGITSYSCDFYKIDPHKPLRVMSWNRVHPYPFSLR